MSEIFRLPKQPVIYEINTAVFLSGLSKKYGKPITLGSVPDEEWKTIADLSVDAVWLMGVWQRSPYSRKVSMQNKEFREVLTDFTEGDNLGSAYSIRAYEVDRLFGGDEGLAKARKALRHHGLGLILDYVPNHIACDHDWVRQHPEYLIAGGKEELKTESHAYTKTPYGVFANGRDPNYAPWSDVLQLNVFSPELRQAVIRTIDKIAAQCDGIRCDMAMLLINHVFLMTWNIHSGMPPQTEYWTDVINGVHKENPHFLFIAEAYWHSEHHLLRLGFDYCYDKPLYDYLAKVKSIQLYHHLHATAEYQSHLLRFIENHDEERAVQVFKGPKYKAAAFITATLPGATLYHEGQLEGYKVKLPVHLRRGPSESKNTSLASFYELIPLLDKLHVREGTWKLCKGNNGFFRSTKLLAWTWTHGSKHYLCVVNYNPLAAKGHFELPPMDSYRIHALFGGHSVVQDSVILRESWLTLTLEPWGYTLFQLDSSD